MKRFTWLHLSDWHQKDADLDRELVANALIEDLRKRAEIDESLGRIDAVFFTGDLAHGGTKAQYELAQKFLLDPVLKVLGLSNDRLFIIPGNHDLDRKRSKLLPEALTRPFRNHAEVLEWFAGAEERAELTKPFRDYEAFVKEYSPAGFSAMGEARFLEIDGYRIGVVGVNSALMCGRNFDSEKEVNDFGYLTVGEQQILKPLGSILPCDLRFGLIHHPFDWLKPFDRALIERRMLAGTDVILRGHEHVADVHIVELAAGRALIVPSGSSWDERVASDARYSNAYSFGSVDLVSGEGDIFLRRWAASNTHWTTDETYPGGRKPFRIERLAAAVPSEPSENSRDLSTTQAEYLAFVARRCSTVDPRGISQTVSQVSLPLDQVYVSLSAIRDVDGLPVIDPHEEAIDDGKEERKKREGNEVPPDRSLVQSIVDLPSALRQHHRIVFLGDPGAGKTTLMRFLAAIHVKALVENRPMAVDGEGAEYGAARLPVLVRIADFAIELERNGSLDLLTFLCQAQSDCGCNPNRMRDLIEERLRRGECIILLDGLDEIVEPGIRARVGERIRAFCDGVGARVPVVVTSRIAGYRAASLGGSFQTFTLRDMDRDQVAKFLSRWCIAVELKLAPNATEMEVRNAAQTQIDGLLASVDGSVGVRRLARNPLLLTILALIHRQGKQLPRRRVELYKIAVQTLLRDWQVDRGPARKGEMSEWDEQFLLAPLAHHMHQEFDNGLIPEAEARAYLRATLAKAQGKPASDPGVHSGVEDFLYRVREHTGVFVERAPGMYGYMHLTFEEYFAAQHLMADPTEAISRIHELRNRARWEEPIRLAIADQKPDFATKLIAGAILGRAVPPGKVGLGESPLEDELHRDLFFALRCFGDSVGVSAELSVELVDRLLKLCLEPKTALELQRVAHAHLPALVGTAGEPAVLEALIAATKDKNPTVRQSAAAALGALGGREPAVLEALIAATKDENWSVRQSAAAALGALGGREPAVLEALIAAIKDQDEDVRGSAAAALGALGGREPAVLEALIAATKDENWSVRQSAAAALGALGGREPAVLEALIAAIKDQDGDVRGSAAAALGALGGREPAVLEALIAAIKDQDEDVRQSAAAALGALGGREPAVLEALIAATKDQDEDVRGSAAAALGALGGREPAVLEALIAATKDENWSVRQSAAAALGALGGREPAVLEALIAAIKDQDGDVRGSAAAALGALGGREPAVLEALIAAIKDENPTVRRSAAAALGALGGREPAVLEALIAATKDENWSVRQSAAAALGALGGREPAVLEALIAAIKDQDGDVRGSAAAALGALGGREPAVLEALIAAIKDENPTVRRSAAAALGALGGREPAVLEALIAATKDENRSVRSAAWQALSDLHRGDGG